MRPQTIGHRLPLLVPFSMTLASSGYGSVPVGTSVEPPLRDSALDWRKLLAMTAGRFSGFHRPLAVDNTRTFTSPHPFEFPSPISASQHSCASASRSVSSRHVASYLAHRPFGIAERPHVRPPPHSVSLAARPTTNQVTPVRRGNPYGSSLLPSHRSRFLLRRATQFWRPSFLLAPDRQSLDDLFRAVSWGLFFFHPERNLMNDFPTRAC